ncbi:hypothetical protein MTP99_015496 [Tenebrio molitor]|nr:hypothetical protein MTP99_015496 [Tenebrio molitor]CAH1374119.1 unnamed protein product [Tenebrio molitor]
MEEYGCNEDVAEDDDSVVSERFWKENHRGDSRKWLLRDGYRKKSGRVMSTMKATYPYPAAQEEVQRIGERRAILLRKLYKEAVEEIVHERSEPPPVEKYCTEYDGNYNQIETTRCDTEEDFKKEMYDKYPLYTSPAMSYWNFKIEKDQRGSTFFPGLTTSADLKNPFKRHSGFTKPISEVLDECNL